MLWFVTALLFPIEKATVFADTALMDVSKFGDFFYVLEMLQPRVVFNYTTGLNVTVNRPPSGTTLDFIGKISNPFVLNDDPTILYGEMKPISERSCSYANENMKTLYDEDYLHWWLFSATKKERHNNNSTKYKVHIYPFVTAFEGFREFDTTKFKTQ